MKEHIKRRIEYSKDVAPEEGTPEYVKVTKMIQQHELSNPNFKKDIKKKQAEAIKTWELQEANGIGLVMDPELRSYLSEFNNRSWAYGHRNMPIMFNVMEAFYTLDKRLNYWTLLNEEDYSISFFDFIDFYTSNHLKHDTNEIKESFIEDLIYNFNVGYDLKNINFKTENGDSFIIGGVSMVRRGNEVTMLFNTGQITDTSIQSKNLTPIGEMERSPGKEKIIIAEDRIREAVKLNDDPNLWKTLIACRIDLDTNTIDARYIAKDLGDSYSILTDDLTGFMLNGKWREPKYEESFKNLAERVDEYNSIFELSKICLLLPNYFDFYNDEIEEEEHDTDVKAILKNSFKSREYKDVDNKFKIRVKPLWVLNRNQIFLSDRIKFRDEKFKVERTGYWKNLEDNEIGNDKNGNAVQGRTWVQKTESYFHAKEDDLIIEKTNDIAYTTPNAGKIYIMRNSSLPKDVFKIGLTTKETEERAKQLSSTSIPDKFHIMREWNVKDCFLAEKTIHKILEKYRVDAKREFFQVEMQFVNEIVDSVIKKINQSSDA